MEDFYRTHSYLVEHVSSPVKRGLMEEINWSHRLIGIKGSRGVGKTTFLLQYAKDHFTPDDRRCLYINLNHLYFADHSLTDFVERFY
ncbi:MAG: AAA family ATPase, partial [Porphyromonadaceae bacterium]|nr:AAA family ATPase [Porphyromonadaceae bacterium]